MIKITDKPGWSFEELRSLNKGGIFSHYDHARVVRQSGNAPIERITQWLQSYEPPLILYRDRIFLEELFLASKYENILSSGSAERDAQFFMNLINISEVLGSDSQVDHSLIVKDVAACWNSLLRKEFPSHLECVEVILEDNDFYLSLFRK